jgi:RNA polymerase sigma factor (sigma-70 family)
VINVSENGTLSETSVTLLGRARCGDADAREELLRRYLPRLRAWAHGRLPRWARDISDTDDIVHDAVTGVLRRLDSFEPRHDAALQAYFRDALWNRIRNELRRVSRQPSHSALNYDLVSLEASPLERAIGREALDRYERALGSLDDVDRQALIGRLEMGSTYDELAGILGKATADAARKTVERALGRLAEAMNDDR